MAIRNLVLVLTDFLIDKDFIWHVTANFNRGTNYAAGRDKIKTWAAGCGIGITKETQHEN